MRTAPAIVLLAAAPASLAQPCLLTYHGQAPHGHAAVYHAGLQKVLIIDEGIGSNQSIIWAWDGSVWSFIYSGGLSPRESAAVVYDTARDRLVLFGGHNSSTGFLGTTWEWSPAGWTALPNGGPAPREGHGMVYDAQRQRTVLFGGYTQSGLVGDTWEWDGQQWVQVAATGPGPSFAGNSMAYDPIQGRTLFYKNFNAERQLWQWDGASWMPVAGNIPDAGYARVVFDRSRGRLVLAGNGLWELDPASGQSWLRQPVLAFSGYAAFNTARSLTVLATGPTLEYDGTASATSPYITQGPLGGGGYLITSTIALSVQADGTPPLTYQWLHSGQPLTDGGRISGATTPNLTITMASLPDSGLYEVLVSNACTTTRVGTNVGVETGCYVNCDASTVPPILNVNDFICFLNAFAAHDLYANCDGASIPPILNVNDFICFMVRYGQGCP